MIQTWEIIGELQTVFFCFCNLVNFRIVHLLKNHLEKKLGRNPRSDRDKSKKE